MEITPIYIISQILAFIAIILTMLAYQQKKKSQILGLTITGDILYGVHYLLLGAWSGVITKVISITRDKGRVPPWQFISTTSSLVYVAGAGM